MIIMGDAVFRQSGQKIQPESEIPMDGNNDRRWSRQVTETSNALDLEPGLFSWEDPRRIARSLRRSAEDSARRRSSPFRSAMSMLNFYINRAGRKLPERQRRVLEKAKEELRELYGRSRKGGRSGPDRPPLGHQSKSGSK
jgi:hypothetical protein